MLTRQDERRRAQTNSAKATATVSPRVIQEIIVIGSSTGGPEALHTLIKSFPPNCPPTLIVQHMKPRFVDSFVARLNECTPAEVVIANDGDILTIGKIYVAGGDATHLVVNPKTYRCQLVEEPPMSGHRPSVDRLFKSVESLGPKVVSVILTGMGKDGAEGMLEILRSGGKTIAQDSRTCVVYGMPRAAMEIGAVQKQLPIQEIFKEIFSPVNTGSRVGQA
ncbi:CheB methylesterase domain-containing protein [Roseobacteraceae bacterium S113]